MTLADLFETLTTRGVLPRAKDCKTALRLLAQALGSKSLEECQVGDVCQKESTWGEELEAHFLTLQTQGRTLSGPNRRNIRSNLRKVFEVADREGLLAVPVHPRLLARPHRDTFETKQFATAPYQATYRSQIGPRRFGLPPAQWPPDIQDGWRTYRSRCGLRLRETSFKAYALGLTSYLGYIAHVVGRPPVWQDCFDVGQLSAFVRWHGVRVGRQVSVHGRHVVMMIAAMAKVLAHENARALADLRNTLKAPVPVHNKRQHHWVSLAQLEAVADACLAEGRLPYLSDGRTRHPGVQRACRFQMGVMLKLLVRIPLRQRNLRELRLGDNLYKDPATGHWQLLFQGGDLKVGERSGQPNRLEVDLSDYHRGDFVPVLEEWLTGYRPRLPGAATSPLCFLTQYGNPFTGRSLGVELKLAVSMRTGKRWYPHMIRTIWATEHLKATGDFTTAATMLGDTLNVVMKTYYDIVHKDQHAKASAFLDTALHTG